jgi:hypothetical protein
VRRPMVGVCPEPASLVTAHSGHRVQA